MSAPIQSFANTGLVTISTANPNLDGTGSLGTVITGGNTGTQIPFIIIKAQGSTAEGMVRLFLDDGVGISLYKEIPIPATVQSSVSQSFQITVPLNLSIDNGTILKASTEKANTFNIIANGVNWNQCDCSPTSCCFEPQNFANTGIVSVSTANSNLDGSGSLGLVLTAATGGVNAGTSVQRVNVKATGNTSQGMVRLFIDNGGSRYLMTEIPIAASVQSNIQPAYRTEAMLSLFLQPGYSIYASTQNSDNFNVMIDAIDEINCNCP